MSKKRSRSAMLEPSAVPPAPEPAPTVLTPRNCHSPAWALMQHMGYRPGAGLGKHEDGALRAAAFGVPRGRHGLGHAAYAPPPPVGRPAPRRYTSRRLADADEAVRMDVSYAAAGAEQDAAWNAHAPMSHIVAHMYPDGMPDAPRTHTRSRTQMELEMTASPQKSQTTSFALVA